MAPHYSVEQCRRLGEIIRDAGLHYTHPPSRYDPGETLDRDITGVFPATPGRASFEIERFVGGGFAGQVYRVRLADLELAGEPIPGLEPGGMYALKILVPPSRFSLLFRNAVYRLAYQAPFSAQVNRSAARTGVLWQKLFRRGAALRVGAENAVADTYATFFDHGLGSFGEVNEWIDGRVWRFEIDEHIFQRRRPTDAPKGSHEYLAKRRFMREIVQLCHAMGAPEFARQYEWWTCKSQPNALKRFDAGPGPADGLTAIDFRAGLALLSFLPMSPADFALIVKGLVRGRFVQFDRGDLDTLDAFCEEHAHRFEDLRPVVEELRTCDGQYRASVPDLTYRGPLPLLSSRTRRPIKDAYVRSWVARGYADEEHGARLGRSCVSFFLFFVLGAVPLLGSLLRRWWARADFARHRRSQLTSLSYLRRSLRARQARILRAWHRAGKVGEGGIGFFLRHPLLFVGVQVFPGLLPLPATWHRFLTDPAFAWTTVRDTVLYPIRFYRDADFRVAWLTNEIEEGAREGMLTAEERDHILERVPDPYIQKYLKCVAVHVCTLPITQVISVVVAFYFLLQGETWTESVGKAGAALAVFQVLPISPGSFVRGTYVVYLMIKERNIRNYWLAVLVSYWHYVGYLGFPLQMVTEFPALSRFMAGRWATKMVHIIPVFGERGGLVEHWVFDLFFNVPLSLKRKLRRQKKQGQ